MGAKPPPGRSPAKAKSPDEKVSDGKTEDGKVPDAKVSDTKVGQAAFDRWLQRGLKQIYGDAASEKLPRELLDLIEQDRAQQQSRKPKKR